MRKLALAPLAALALPLAVAAAAGGGWTTVAGSGLSNIVDPSVLRTQAGSTLVAFDSPNAHTISVARSGAAPRVVVAGDPAAGEAQLVQQPNGAIQLYFPNAQGIARLSSTDDGRSWTGPVQTASTDVGGVAAAAVRPDGTPLFSQDGTGFLNVFQGLNGEVERNVFPACCPYAESLAVDTAGLAQTAFWSNATSPKGFVYEALDGSLGVTRTIPLTGNAETIPFDNRVPLVADRSGNTFAAYVTGYPAANALWVQRFQGGSASGRPARLWRGELQRLALAVEPDGKLWALWTADGAVRAARSRSFGAHFGAQVRVPLPAGATPYQLEALAGPGSLTAYVNTGSALLASTKLLPGLGVSLHRTGRSWTAVVVDDGVGVGGATIRGGGRTLHTNGSGRAALAGLPHHLFMRVSASGYTGAGFRVP